MGVARVLRAVVRNDAMRSDPDAIYNGRTLALVCCACFGGMLFGWNTGTISGVIAMDHTRDKFGYLHRSKTDQANLDQNIVSTLQAGSFTACLFTSWFADKFGRRWSLIGSGMLTATGIMMEAVSAATGSLAVMYVGRFTAGLGVGAASILTPLYVSECVPRAIRGGLTAFYQLFNVFGNTIAFWINYGCLLHVKAPAVYIVPLSLQALPALLLIAGMLASPESPRWCARHDRESATKILVKLRSLPADSVYVSQEMDEMWTQLEQERSVMGEASFKSLMREMCLVPANRKRAIITFVLMCFQQLTGVNAINYYAPQIFRNLGMTGIKSSLFATGVYGVVKILGCVIFLLFIADSVGRRRSMLVTCPPLTATLFIIGIYGRVQPPVTEQPISAFGYVAITCCYLWAAIFQCGWGPSSWILISEIPTMRLRAINVSIGAATQWLCNYIMARTVLTMQNTMGYKGYGMFFLFGSFSFLSGIFVYFFVPETKGLSLEKMDELFGLTEPTKQQDAEPGSEPEAGEKGSGWKKM